MYRYIATRVHVSVVYLNIYAISFMSTHIYLLVLPHRYYNIYKSVKADWKKITRSSSRCIILNIVQQQSYSVDILCVHCTLVRLIMDYKVWGRNNPSTGCSPYNISVPIGKKNDRHAEFEIHEYAFPQRL